MKTLSGRRLFFATGADLAPGLRSVEQRESLQFVLEEMRDDAAFTAIDALSTHSALGASVGNSVMTSPRYQIFRRGEIPAPREVPQRSGRRVSAGIRSHRGAVTDALRSRSCRRYGSPSDSNVI